MVKKNRKKRHNSKTRSKFKNRKIPPLEKNSKILCAKYQGFNIKTVPWAQKVNFCQKNTKKVKEKNTFSPLTKKIIKISKNKKYHF